MPILAAPVLASIIGGGAAIGGTLISKSGQQNIANQQQQQAQQLFDRSSPAYTSAQNYYQGLMNNPLQQPGITDAQLQFNQARNNLINSSASRGGGLDAGLANLEAGKAVTMSQLLNQGRATGAAGLSSLASGQSSQGLAALAGAQQSQLQNAQQQALGLSGVGSFLTRLMAGLSQNSSQPSNISPDNKVNIPGAIFGGTDTNNGGAFFPGTANA